MEEKGKSKRKRLLKLSMIIASLSVLLVTAAMAFTFLAVTPVIAQEAEVTNVTVNAPEYVEKGKTFTVTIDVDSVTDLFSAQFNLSFNPNVVEISDVKKGEINGEAFPTFAHRSITEDTERVLVSMPIGEGVSGSGYLAEIEFKAKGEEGEKIVLDISEGTLGDKKGPPGGELFSIEGEEFKNELNDEEIYDDLKEIFEDKGYPLENPTVEVMAKGTRWKISDETENERERYLLIAEKEGLTVTDAGVIPAKWIDAEIRIGEEKEEEEEEEEEVGEEVTSGSPNITAWNPAEAVVGNVVGESKTFNITVDQIAAISWQINDTEVQTNESTREAVFTNASAVIGTRNVSVIATNTTTGLSDVHTWIWSVTPTATVTPTPTQAPGVTRTPEAEIEGTPTPQEKRTAPKEKTTPVPAATSTPKQEVPGFEAVFAIAVMLGLGIVYILQRR